MTTFWTRSRVQSTTTPERLGGSVIEVHYEGIGMLFQIDGEGTVDQIPERQLAELGLRERDDLQEWIIEQPRILGEELLVVTSEYAGFEETRNRLDVLALDRTGKLVVIELKRDRADSTVDLQALQYASFCSTLTAEDVQELYKEFHDEREQLERSQEDVRDRFVNILETDDFEIGNDGWLHFELDDRPRVLIAAGEFGTEITSPVLWLFEEFGLDISCVRLSAYAWEGQYLIQGQRIIPVPEAEEYMTKRREKQQRRHRDRRRPTLPVLLEREILQKGDVVIFNEKLLRQDRMPDDAEQRWDPTDPLWQAVVTGKTGSSNNVRWRYDGEQYSFTGLTRAVMRELGADDSGLASGFWYWIHPEYDDRPLSELRDAKVTAMSQKEAG